MALYIYKTIGALGDWIHLTERRAIEMYYRSIYMYRFALLQSAEPTRTEKGS